MEADEVRRRHAQTGAAWDEAAARYAQEIAADVAFLRAGGTNFCPPEYAHLADLGSWCGRAVHLQCAGGRDTLSLWNLGAREVVGVDISARMLACARAKSEALGAPATWVRSDILETPSSLDGTADLVYTGRGALCWMLDIDAWARVAARLLAPGGMLYVFDGHPMDWVWDMEADHYRLDPRYGNYFSEAVETEAGWPSVYIPEDVRPEEGWSPKHERQWTLGAIVTAVARAGLRIEALEEHPDDYWDGFAAMRRELRPLLPHTFSLRARGPGR